MGPDPAVIPLCRAYGNLRPNCVDLHAQLRENTSPWPTSWAVIINPGLWAQKRGFERAGDCRHALAGPRGIADDGDLLPRPGETLDGVAGRPPGPVVEPVA